MQQFERLFLGVLGNLLSLKVHWSVRRYQYDGNHSTLEAMVLVFIVMYLFYIMSAIRLFQRLWRLLPYSVLFTVMLLAGFSINVLTMFGMVLAIGIIVDDAIVVVENVERIMATEGLSPKDATSKAMKEITSPIIGITLVLAAVFLPMAFASGSVG